MEGRSRQVSWVSQARWALPVAAVAGALVFSLVSGSHGHELLTATARATAVALLLFVCRASVEMGNRWRVFSRHDSIRADIAAAGGLGKRLSV
ncbi:MAG TPA: hypothetical protein VHM89_13985 [Acidimicrobiales bacterium]|nr:hypothetical protein [Acidimicrobiales bacterium]